MMAPADRISAQADEDDLRACVYRLLSRFLASPPDQVALAVAGRLDGDDSELGRALVAFARTARVTSMAEARDEYDQLMIGLVRGELVPYASFYLTGFLHERPLAAVRGDFARLGICRATGGRTPRIISRACARRWPG